MIAAAALSMSACWTCRRRWPLARWRLARTADHQQIGLILVQQTLDRGPVDAVIGHPDGGAGGGCMADGIAGGDTDTTQTEIEGQDDATWRVRHVRR
jgi:hypothetical protein